jgi:mannose-1-phosphate guanylyltransferase
MRAVVLVGGFGTRLRPLTYARPKQMLPIGHRTMLEVVVSRLGTYGVTEAVLSLGYKPDTFQEAFPGDEIDGVRLRYAVEPTPLDTAGAICFAARHAGIDETFVVVNGDVIGDLPIDRLLALHRDQGAEGTVHLIEVEDPSPFGVVVTDAAGRVERFVEKPPRETAPSRSINAGTYVLEPSVLDRIHPGVPDAKISIERVTFPAMAADGTLYGALVPGYWLDAGKLSSYLQANLDAVTGVGPVGPEPAVAASADVASTATIEGSLVGADAVVGHEATVRGSLLLPGARVEDGALVEHSIVGYGATVRSGAEVIGAAVHDGATVDGKLRALN